MNDPARLRVTDGSVVYRDRTGTPFSALHRISFSVLPGKTLGVVGESGCGKSSLAKLIANLTAGKSGNVYLDGQRIDTCSERQWKHLRRRMQYVFQDPLGALDPRMPMLQQVREPLNIHRIGEAGERREVAEKILRQVGIDDSLFNRPPLHLSGGQRQRVVLARALVLRPDVLLCDEPVSALDVSVQAQVLKLLIEFQTRLGLTMLFISHDLAVVRHISHRIAIMYLGQIVELGDVDDVFTRPSHPYTRALLDAVPRFSERRKRLLLRGETPSPLHRPLGCSFYPRCPFAENICRKEVPRLTALGGGRTAACHFPFIAERKR